MKKKRPPEQYAPKAKPVTLPVTKSAAHPAVGLAKELVKWIDRGGVPLSIILLHGLYLARTSENDGLPVDTLRPQLKMQGTDNKAISEILDILSRPQTAKNKVIAGWLQSVWVNKTVVKPRILPSSKERRKPTASKKPVNRPRKA
jgi:hypothetical protein